MMPITLKREMKLQSFLFGQGALHHSKQAGTPKSNRIDAQHPEKEWFEVSQTGNLKPGYLDQQYLSIPSSQLLSPNKTSKRKMNREAANINSLFLLIVTGNSQSAPDTLECRRSHHGFCKRYSCPGVTLPTGGTCQWGSLLCCKS